MDLKNKLKRYTILATATLGGATLNAEVIHTDVNPDEVLTNDSDLFEIDINNDGNANVQFQKRILENSYTTTSSSNTYTYFTTYNFITFSATSNAKILASIDSAINYDIPIVNSLNDIIGNGINWKQSGVFGINESWSGSNRGSLDAGNWQNTTDKYVGVQLTNGVDVTYGWVKVSVSDALNSITIKDYAWQDVPGVPLLAGDMSLRNTSPATNVVIADTNDLQTGQDFQVSFTKAIDESLVGKYQIVVIKSSIAPTFDVDSVRGIPLSSRFYINPTGSNISTNLNGLTTDSDGDALTFGSSYNVFVISIPDGTNANDWMISSASNTLILSIDKASVATNVVAQDISNNGNGTDLEFSFTKGSFEASVNEYKALVVKKSKTPTFDFDSANSAILASNFIFVPKTGNNITATFGATDKDTDGDLITENIEYNVFIFSNADGVNTTKDNLSLPSNDVILLPIASPATNLVASDVSSNSNGTDLQISFNKATDESTINEYRAIVVKSSDALNFNLDSAHLAISNSYYLPIAKTGSNITTIFTSNSVDANGDTLGIGVEYNVFIVSANDGVNATIDIISTPSNAIVLNTEASIATNLVASDVANNGNGTDLQISFNKGADESTIDSYAVMIVKNSNAASFSLNDALAVSASNYLPVAKTGSNISAIFGTSDLDVDGDVIAQGVAYKLFVLSIKNNTTSNISSLSSASNTITLSLPIVLPTNVVATDVADNNKPSDMQVTFDGIGNESQISRYEILVVNENAAASISNAELQEMLDNGYSTSVLADGSTAYTQQLSNFTRDENGAIISNNRGYKVFVASIANNSTSFINNFSEPSDVVILRNYTGVKEELDNNVKVTAFENVISISTNTLLQNGQIIIVNSLGQTVFTSNINSKEMQISELKVKGMYFVTIKTNNAAITKKVMLK